MGNKIVRRGTDTDDAPTPITDKLIDDMLHGDGIPRCDEWDRMVAHAKEMERWKDVYRAVSIAVQRP